MAEPKISDSTTITLKISGMSCRHCVDSIMKALSSLPGVKHVDVDLEAGRAVVVGAGLDGSALRSAVEALGFDAE